MSLSEALPTTAIDSLTLRRSLHAEAQQATASEGLAQDRYVATRVGFEPVTFRTKGIDSTNEPPRLHNSQLPSLDNNIIEILFWYSILISHWRRYTSRG